MKILVVYSSRKTGNTEKIARAIAARFGNECQIFSAENAPKPDNYDFIALGFGVYRGWPDGDMRAYMKRCRHKDAGLFMTLGAWPDSDHAACCLGRAEGLLETCRIRVKFACQGAYAPEFLARLQSLPPTSSHGWTPERAKRVMEAMKHPDDQDLRNAADCFSQAAGKLRQGAPVVPQTEKRAIVTAFFGSTISSAPAAYEKIETALQESFPGIPVRRAYTSGMVRKKLDYSVPSLPGVLKELQLAGFNRIDLLAGMLSPGEEYHKLLRDVSAFSSQMEIRVSRPPLSDLVMLRAFLRAAVQGIPAERTAHDSVLFMGHGNRDGRSDFIYMAAAAELKKIDPCLHLACVEGNPSFENVASEISPGKVWLIPLMLVAGDHALCDMAGAEDDSWKSKLNAQGHDCECVLHGLGEFGAVADFWVNELKKTSL